jgi:hypothetical protein
MRHLKKKKKRKDVAEMLTQWSGAPLHFQDLAARRGHGLILPMGSELSYL